MSKFSDYTQNKQISKGGIIGGLLGALASTKSYSANDSTLKKVGKIGLFAAIGYFVGEFIEKLFSRSSRSNSR